MTTRSPAYIMALSLQVGGCWGYIQVSEIRDLSPFQVFIIFDSDLILLFELDIRLNYANEFKNSNIP